MFTERSLTLSVNGMCTVGVSDLLNSRMPEEEEDCSKTT